MASVSDREIVHILDRDGMEELVTDPELNFNDIENSQTRMLMEKAADAINRLRAHLQNLSL